MVTLTIDTAFGLGIGLLQDETVVGFQYLDSSFNHIEKLVPTIKELLLQGDFSVQDLDRVVVNVGPSPFTGLRAGLSVAKAFRETLQIPAIGVSCLEVEASIDGNKIDTMYINSAKRNLLYCYNLHDKEFQILSPSEIALLCSKYNITRIVGRGWSDYPEQFQGLALENSQLSTDYSVSNYQKVAYKYEAFARDSDILRTGTSARNSDSVTSTGEGSENIALNRTSKNDYLNPLYLREADTMVVKK
jgi:tRNA threonylcarbamoyl adenosine modification protein YeaZ